MDFSILNFHGFVCLNKPKLSEEDKKLYDAAYTKLLLTRDIDGLIFPESGKIGIVRKAVDDEHGYWFHDVEWEDGTTSLKSSYDLYFPKLHDKISILDIAEKHYDWVDRMGWHGKATPLELLALVASEIGEAVNECRGEEPTDKLGSELADIILRTLDMSLVMGIDIEKELLNKIHANELRGNKGRII